MNDDTEKLLQICNAGIRITDFSVNKILPKVKSDHFKQYLSDCKQENEKLADETRRLLNLPEGTAEKPSRAVMGMYWSKVNTKFMRKPTDSTAADLITEACNMGLDMLDGYTSQYREADEQAESIARQLMQSGERLILEVREFH
ncbi:MAG TPA: hypothetical protein VHP31_07020 [Caproicibacter sp.]|nr:hypothetical protein [Caproicibacter sp.]